MELKKEKQILSSKPTVEKIFEEPTSTPKGTPTRKSFEAAAENNGLTFTDDNNLPNNAVYQTTAVGEKAKKGEGYAAVITYYEYRDQEHAQLAAHRMAEGEKNFLRKHSSQKGFKDTIHAYGVDKLEFIYENEGYYIRSYADGRRMLYLQCYTAQKEVMTSVWNETLQTTPKPDSTAQPSE